MSLNLIATDVPAWLKNVLLKIDWNNLGFGMKPIITGLVNKECANLPKKTGDSRNVNHFQTYAPDEILLVINNIDFARMPANVQNQFKAKIESSVKTYLGVKL